MTKRTKMKVVWGTTIGFLSGLAAVILWVTGCLDRFELKTWDLRVQRLCGPGPATDKVRLILIDQNSLDWARDNQAWTWEWAREVYAELIAFCRDAGARAVILDMFFLEPSRYGVTDDAMLGAAMQQASNTVIAMALSRESGSTSSWPSCFPEPRLRATGLEFLLSDPAFSNSLAFSSATVPIPDLASNAAVVGDVFLNPDSDGTYRRVLLFRSFDGRLIPSLALAGLMAGENGAQLDGSDGTLRINNRRVHMDRNGYATLNFRGPAKTHVTVSASQVFASMDQIRRGQTPQVDPALFKDCYVLIGVTAFGLYDLRQSAVSGVYPGVEVHATALDNLLSGDFFRAPGRAITVTTAMALGILSGLLLIFATGARQSVILMAGCLAIPVAASTLAFLRGINTPILVHLLACTGGSLGAMVINYASEGRQRRFLKKAFQQYLSPVVINQLLENPSALELGGQVKDLSISFSDIRGFTQISEQLGPRNTTAFLNEYLTELTAIIHDEQGTIDKYVGDCIVTFWNAPLEQPEHARLAVRAALLCRRRLAQLRPKWQDRFHIDVEARTGIATGPVLIGNMGSRQRFDYSFIGDTGNLASRLEGVNKVFGTYLLIDEETHGRLAAAFPAREIASVQVVGRNQPIRIYEPMNSDDYRERERMMAVFQEGLSLFYAGRFKEALGVFASISHDDPPSDAYARRCSELAENPPSSWTGVWQMQSK